jgi:Beta-galactosidase/beta-glucuronidase
MDEKGRTLEATALKIGFRTAEIKNRQFLVNGQPGTAERGEPART